MSKVEVIAVTSGSALFKSVRAPVNLSPERVAPLDNPYEFARRNGMEVDSLDDYLAVLDRLLSEAKRKNAICLKSTLVYNRTLHFENVPKEHAAAAFGKPGKELTKRQIKDFEDFIMWRLVELSSKSGFGESKQ